MRQVLSRDWRPRRAKALEPALEEDGDTDTHIKTESEKRFEKRLNNEQWKHKRASN